MDPSWKKHLLQVPASSKSVGPIELVSEHDGPRDQAAAHPISGAHSIWEIVLHLTTDYVLVLRRLSGDGRQLTPEEDWPPCPAVTDENWRKATQDLANLNQELRQAVHAFPGARLDEPLVSEVPYTAYTQFIGITQHNLYHAGQIALLKRALRTA